jgi:hypothetical protein
MPDINLHFDLDDAQLPVDYLLTDQTPESLAAADIWQRSGSIRNAAFPAAEADLLPEQGFGSYALLGERQRVRSGKNMNFCEEDQAVKTRITVWSAGACLLLLLITGVVWYRQFAVYQQLGSEVRQLQERVEQLQGFDRQAGAGQWEQERQGFQADIQALCRVLDQVTEMQEELIVTRWSYRQGRLDIYAEAMNNEAFMELMNRIALYGGKLPVLESYTRQKDRIIFVLSVNR